MFENKMKIILGIGLLFIRKCIIIYSLHGLSNKVQLPRYIKKKQAISSFNFTMEEAFIGNYWNKLQHLCYSDLLSFQLYPPSSSSRLI